MAFIPKSGITTGGTIQASHVVNIIESLDGTGSYQITATGSFSGSFVGNGAGITGVTGEWDGTLNGNAQITGSLIVTAAVSASSFSGSFSGSGVNVFGIISSSFATSASLAQTASFVSPTFISASAAASGFGGAAFPFSGSAQITGSLNVTGSITVLNGAYTNYTTQSVPLTIQTGYNALLVGPLFNSSSITIQAGARLVIL